VNIETHKILLVPFVWVYCLWSKMSLQVLLSCCWFWTSGLQKQPPWTASMHTGLCHIHVFHTRKWTEKKQKRKSLPNVHTDMGSKVYHHCYATIWCVWKWNDPPVNTLLCHRDKPSWNHQEDLQ
jgi:hypothetical protein